MNENRPSLRCLFGRHDWKREGHPDFIFIELIGDAHDTSIHAFTCTRCPAVQFRYEHSEPTGQRLDLGNSR